MMHKYQCTKTGRVCFSYDRWLRAEVIKSPQCFGCRSNREQPETDNQARTENQNGEVLSIDQPCQRPAEFLQGD